MSRVLFHYICLIAGFAASLRLLDEDEDCTQPGLDQCKVYNCSNTSTIQSGIAHHPFLDPVAVEEGMDKHGTVPAMNVTWRIEPDGAVLDILGSIINILDKSTNQSICKQFSYKLRHPFNPNGTRWTFTLHGVVFTPTHTYTVSVYHTSQVTLPDPRDEKTVTMPSCVDARIRTTRVCLENGSMWEPNVTSNTVVSTHTFLTTLVFETAEYSDRYNVSLQGNGFLKAVTVLKGERKFLNVTFELDSSKVSPCKAILIIKPFFIRCQNNCQSHKETIDYCPYFVPRTSLLKGTVALLVVGVIFAFLLLNVFHKASMNTSSPVAEEQPESFQVTERKKVLIIYSLDHHLYKDIVLKLCAFLKNKCGIEVVVDLLDSSWLGTLGSIQWLDLQREQIEKSTNKILILCSQGVQAKWRAMCGDQRVLLREDVRSPVGDMLTPALTLIVPCFVRHASFEKYIVAYFDDICSEDDVPSPFNITLRYKLMKQFEEVFFRILDIEKNRPGRVNHIKGLAGDEYHHCASGKALRDAIEAFQIYQQEHPWWFEEELLESSDMELEELREDGEIPAHHITYFGRGSAQVFIRAEGQDSDFTVERPRFNIEVA